MALGAGEHLEGLWLGGHAGRRAERPGVCPGFCRGVNGGQREPCICTRPPPDRTQPTHTGRQSALSGPLLRAHTPFRHPGGHAEGGVAGHLAAPCPARWTPALTVTRTSGVAGMVPTCKDGCQVGGAPGAVEAGCGVGEAGRDFIDVVEGPPSCPLKNRVTAVACCEVWH